MSPIWRKRLKRIAFAGGSTLALAIAIPFILGCCVFSAPKYSGPKTGHFDGTRFHNQVPVEEKGGRDFWKWRFTRNPGTWTKQNHEPGPPPPDEVRDSQVRVTFVNHATVLIQMHGVNILTDPIWSDRCSPVSWAGPKRYRPPGIRFEDLPPIHAVLISHNHYDHLDLPTLEQLRGAHDPRFLVPLGNSALLRENGMENSTDLDWWDTVELTPTLNVHFVPAQHWSGRGTCDRHKTLWGGFVVQSAEGHVYYAGDTGDGPHFEQVAERFGPPELIILPIGAYLPQWFMQDHHISPGEAVSAFIRTQSRYALAVHYGTFELADDGQHQPVEDLRAALQQAELSEDRFWILPEGEARTIQLPGETQVTAPPLAPDKKGDADEMNLAANP